MPRFLHNASRLAVVGALLSPLVTFAQADRGSVKGVVHDEQNASIPSAQLTLRNEATGTQFHSVSLTGGDYSFSNLTPGLYTLTVEAPGFGKTVQQHLVIAVGTTTPLELTLRTANVNQVVTVSSADDSVDTQTSEIGTVITPREIEDLPVPMSNDMRNPLSFVTLTPGVAGSEPGASPDYRLHISGSPSDSNEVYIDGVPIVNTNLQGDASLNHPPIDAISEFKIVNNNQSAQFGLASSAVSFAFKSGGNTYHGSAFEFLQNDKLDANDYVSNALGQKRAPLKQNEYGGTFSGPVRLPKLYNGHDKTFFFFEYTQFAWRPSSNNASLTTLPDQYRAGNFQQALGPQLVSSTGELMYDLLGKPIYSGEIYDPLSTTQVTAGGQTYTVRNAFANNSIATSAFSTVATKILPYFPMASNNGINNNFFRVQATKNDEHRLVAKIDHTFNDKNNISGSFFMGSYDNGNNGTLSPLDGDVTSAPTKQFRFTYNYAHSPRVSNNLNAGFLRDTGVNGPPQLGPGLQALGINGLPTPAGAAPFPIVNLQGSLSTEIGSGGSSSDAENRFLISDNLTMIRGSHSFTLGGELRRLQRNELGVGTPAFNFTQTETAQNGVGHAGSPTGPLTSIPAGTGNSGASFLVGAVDFSNASFPISQGYRWLQTGMYIQDDWKARKNLVLNLGLRYDIQVPRTEVNGYASTVNVNLPNPAAGDLPGAYTFYGKGPGRNGQARIGTTDFKAFQPRIGFAFTPFEDQKTSIRGGYGITRPTGNDNLENGIGSSEYSIGFSGAAIASKPGDTVGSPAFYLDNGFPASGVTPAVLSPGILVGLTNPAIIYPKAGSPPTQMNWTLQLQQELPGKMVASIGYVGSHSYHIGVWSKPNQISPAVASRYVGAAASVGLALNDYLQQPIDSTAAAAGGVKAPFPNFVNAIGAAGATIGQALRPFPQYGSVDNPINPIGSVSYNGLQSSLQRRFSNGLTFLVAYTFSKTLGNVDSNNGSSSGAENAQYSASFYQDYYNPRAERSVTSSDIPQVVALSYTYELPVGRGRALLNRGGVVNQALGGWKVAGIQQYQSGRPVHIEYDAFGDADPYYATDGFSYRPNLVPGQPLRNPGYRKSCSGPVQPNAVGASACSFYINPNAFVAPPAGQFGDAPHFLSGLRLPWFLNENVSLLKDFHIYDRTNLQFQANFFNVLNRVVFSNGGNPNTFIFNNAPANLGSALENTTSVFGLLTDQQNGPRMVQFALKLEF
jgi:hypothetical protein